MVRWPSCPRPCCPQRGARSLWWFRLQRRAPWEVRAEGAKERRRRNDPEPADSHGGGLRGREQALASEEARQWAVAEVKQDRGLAQKHLDQGVFPNSVRPYPAQFAGSGPGKWEGLQLPPPQRGTEFSPAVKALTSPAGRKAVELDSAQCFPPSCVSPPSSFSLISFPKIIPTLPESALGEIGLEQENLEEWSSQGWEWGEDFISNLCAFDASYLNIIKKNNNLYIDSPPLLNYCCRGWKCWSEIL